MRKIAVIIGFACTLAACATVPAPQPTLTKQPAIKADLESDPRLDARTAVRNFVEVVETVEPVAESECRRLAPGSNCDFLIVVDDRPGQPPNAFQTQDDTGRPVIAFTIPLIAEARNRDELAFIMAHEASHHIRGHLDRQRRNATIGATVLGQLISVAGGSADAVRQSQQIGASLGARTYSKDFELEADGLGTVIAARAGFDPVRGSAFFARIPDPGSSFLSTHPANAERIALVRRVASQL